MRQSRTVERASVTEYFRLIFKVYLAFISFVTVCYGLMNWRIRSDWAIGEWLINYQAGFIRRGLTGEVALLVGRALHVSPMTIVVLMQLLLYGLMLYAVWRLLEGTDWELWVMALVLSPATLAFQVLDPPAGFRKEEIHLAGLGMLLVLLMHPRVRNSHLVLYLSLVCTAAVLSHEPLICYTPYYFGAVVIGRQSIRRGLSICVLPLLVCAGAAILAVLRPGNFKMAQEICRSIGEKLTDSAVGVCGGAIYYLGNNQGFARQELIGFIHYFHYYRVYSVATLLSSIPIVMAIIALSRDRRLRFDLKILAGTIGVAGAGSLVLFLYSTDWGRWIYIHVFSVFLILLFIDYRRRAMPRVEKAVLPTRLSGRRVFLGGLFLAVYALCWDLPHVGIYAGRFGYFDLVLYLHQYQSTHGLGH